MKKTFKRFLSSALAAVMAASVLSVGMVTSASAAAKETVIFDGTDSANIVYGQDVTCISEAGTRTVMNKVTDKDNSTLVATPDGKSTADGKAFKARLKLQAENTDYIKFKASGDFKIKFYYRSGGKNKDIYIENSSDGTTYSKLEKNTHTVNKDGDYVLYLEDTITCDPSKEFYMITVGGEVSFYYVAIEPLAKEDGTISLKVNNPDKGTTSVTVNGEPLNDGASVEASADDPVVISAIASDGYDADLYVGGETVELTENEYTFNVNGDTDIVISYNETGKAKTIDAPTVATLNGDLGDKDKAPYANGDIIGGYFTAVVDNDGATDESKNIIKRTGNNCIQTAAQELGKLAFETTVPLKVTIPFASTGNSNVSDLVILDSEGNVVAHETVTGTTYKNLVIDNLPAGKYEIASPTAAHGATGADKVEDTTEEKALNSTLRGARLQTVTFAEPAPTLQTASGAQVAVYQSGKDLYTISVVTAADAEAYNKVSQQVDATDITTASDTVYTGVQIDEETVLTAEDLGGTAEDYVYAVKIEVTQAENAPYYTSDAITNIKTITTVLS